MGIMMGNEIRLMIRLVNTEVSLRLSAPGSGPSQSTTPLNPFDISFFRFYTKGILSGSLNRFSGSQLLTFTKELSASHLEQMRGQ